MKRRTIFHCLIFLLVVGAGIMVQAGGVSDHQKRWLGPWDVSLDGWKRSMVIRLPLEKDNLGPDWNATGIFYDEINDKKAGLELKAYIDNSHRTVIIVLNRDGSTRLKLMAHLFNQNPSEMAGYYEHDGVKYGFYAKKKW